MHKARSNKSQTHEVAACGKSTWLSKEFANNSAYRPEESASTRNDLPQAQRRWRGHKVLHSPWRKGVEGVIKKRAQLGNYGLLEPCGSGESMSGNSHLATSL